MDLEKLRTNFSKASLLKNLPIILEKNECKYVFNMPTLEFECVALEEIRIFYGFCASNMDDIKDKNSSLDFDNKYDFARAAIRNNDIFGRSILMGMYSVIQDFKYVDDSFYCGDSPLDSEIFDFLCLAVSIASASKNWEDIEKDRDYENMSKEEKKWERKKRENQAKIDSLKEKKGKGYSLDKIIVAVMHDFSMSIEEVYKLNRFGLYYLFSCCNKVVFYEVAKIGTGTGNIGKNYKHKHWINY